MPAHVGLEEANRVLCTKNNLYSGCTGRRGPQGSIHWLKHITSDRLTLKENKFK